MRVVQAVLPFLLAIGAFAQSSAPSYLEFSTFFQFRPNSSDFIASASTATGSNGEFYVAGTVMADPPTLAAFSKQPINAPSPFGHSFQRISFVARFSGTGELLEWRLLWGVAPVSFSPSVILTNISDRVALLYWIYLPEPATEGAFLPSGGGVSLLVLSRDLRNVLVSTFVVPFNSTVQDAALDRDGSLVFAGSSYAAFARDGTIVTASAEGPTSPFLARLSPDGKSLNRIQLLSDPSLGATGGTRVALAPDGGVWLGTSGSSALLPTIGAGSQSYSGVNTASWNPSGGEWVTALRPELTLSSPTVRIQGNPLKTGEFFASDGIQLFHSNNFGQSWEKLTGFPGGTVTWCLSDPTRLYTWEDRRLWVSTDSGGTWDQLDIPFSFNAFILQLAVSAQNADIIALSISNSGASYYSTTDGGKTWKGTPRPDIALSPLLAVEGATSPRLLLLDEATGVQSYEGNGWHVLSRPLGPIAAYFPGVSPVVAYQDLTGKWSVSKDSGATWKELLCKFQNAPCLLWINPSSPDEWWLTSENIVRSTDGGTSWTTIRDSVGAAQVASLAFTGVGEQPVIATTARRTDLYLQKLDAAWKQLQFATYFGGTSDENLVALLVDSNGRLNVVSTTSSSDYPVTADALQSGIANTGVALTRFSPSGDAIEFSTVWGGDGYDRLARARLLPGDRIVWCGTTTASSIPNLSQPIPALSLYSTNVFVGGFDPASLGWLPGYLFGGDANSATMDCAATSDGKIAVTGITDNPTFPLAGNGFTATGNGRKLFISLIRP